jgi:hypothetical protein
MTGDEDVRFADDDPEYATDAAAEIDVEVVAFEEEDPQNVPSDRATRAPLSLPWVVADAVRVRAVA